MLPPPTTPQFDGFSECWFDDEAQLVGFGDARDLLGHAGDGVGIDAERARSHQHLARQLQENSVEARA